MSSKATKSAQRASARRTDATAPSKVRANTVSASAETEPAVYNSRIAAFVRAGTPGGRSVYWVLYFIGWLLLRGAAAFLFFTMAYFFAMNTIPNIISTTQKTTGVALDSSVGLLWGVLIAPSGFLILVMAALYFIVARWLWGKMNGAFHKLFVYDKGEFHEGSSTESQ